MRPGKQQSGSNRPMMENEAGDTDEIMKGTGDGMSKLSRASPGEAAEGTNEKHMTIQEHIDAYYGGLE